MQGTVLGIAVDLCALSYLLRLISQVLTKRASPFGRSQSAPTVPFGEEPQTEVWCVSGRRRGSESEASVVLPWPGLPVGEAGQSRKRASPLLGQAFRLETGSLFWLVI